jgi:hypothetical protein
MRRFHLLADVAALGLAYQHQGGVKISAWRTRSSYNEPYESSIDEKELPAKQYPSPEGVKTILDELALKDSKARAAKPSDFIDARFVEEFDRSGYTDSLYGKK